MFKRILSFVFAVFVVLSFAGCGSKKFQSTTTDQHHKMITEAVDTLLDAWEEEYEKSAPEADGYVQITNTRVVIFKENNNEFFQDVAYMVEFVVFSDYFGSAPYYANTYYLDSVVVYKDGTMEVQKTNLLRQYSSMNYSYDYSEFLDSVKDYGDAYNIEKNVN